MRNQKNMMRNKNKALMEKATSSWRVIASAVVKSSCPVSGNVFCHHQHWHHRCAAELYHGSCMFHRCTNTNFVMQTFYRNPGLKLRTFRPLKKYVKVTARHAQVDSNEYRISSNKRPRSNKRPPPNKHPLLRPLYQTSTPFEKVLPSLLPYFLK